jgi:hypothetical protein
VETVRLKLWIIAVAAGIAGLPGIARAQDCNVLEVTNENAAATPNVCAFDAAKNAAANTKLRHVLLYDWSNGGHAKTHTQRHMMRLAKKYGFRLDRSQSVDYITTATLQGVDLVVVNNSDADAFSNPTSLAAMRNFIESQGKAMLLIHAAAAFIPCPNEDLASPDCRWIMRAVRTQFWQSNNHNIASAGRIYADSVFAGQVPPNALTIHAVPAVRNHGRRATETWNIFENLPLNGPTGPLANRPYLWDGLWDEWFTYRNHPRLEGTRVLDGVTYGPINILLSLDESTQASGCSTSSSSNSCNMGDRPVSWTRTMGNGLAAYNNAGHGDVYVRTRVVDGVPVNDSLMEKYNWRLMKYLARDFVGCMNPADVNYSPQATVQNLTPSDPACPCQQSSNCVVSARPEETMTRHGAVRVGIVPLPGSFRITLPAPGTWRVRVTNAAGREVAAVNATMSGHGADEPLMIQGITRGVYLVEVRGARGDVFRARVAAAL